jgi:phenylacetate-CoA ligase
VSSEYQVILTREAARDNIRLKVEGEPGASPAAAAETTRTRIKSAIGILAEVEVIPAGTLPRSEKKTRRIFDERV